MKRLSKWVMAMVASVLLAGTALGADALASGKVKSVDAANKSFVMTDAAGKDFTFTLDEKAGINRAGKDVEITALKPGEEISLLYVKGVLKSMAEYILVHEGDYKNCRLGGGSFKTWDADQKRLTLTGFDKKAYTFEVGADTQVQLAGKSSKIDELKLGDQATVIYDRVGDKLMIRQLIADRRIAEGK